jgi:hypothetical protein
MAFPLFPWLIGFAGLEIAKNLTSQVLYLFHLIQAYREGGEDGLIEQEMHTTTPHQRELKLCPEPRRTANYADATDSYGMNKVVVAGGDALPAVSVAITSMVLSPNTPYAIRGPPDPKRTSSKEPLT